MIQTIVIDSVEKATEILLNRDFDGNIGRLRSSFYFHGTPDCSFHLTTSLARNCKQLKNFLEPCILRNFTKYAVIDDPSLANSIWKQMIVGQHHGLPTRLLDWTLSPLVALHFAMTETNLEDLSARDAAVWRINSREIKATLPEKYRRVLERENTQLFSINTLPECAKDLEEYDRDMKDSSFALIEPPSFDQRITNQYAFFSIIPGQMDDIESFLDKQTETTTKYIIRKEIRWMLRDMLDQMNINERIIYPGLDGISTWVARHYYVKNNT